MLLDQQEKPFSDQAYVFEPKIDGHRLVISKTGNETRLFTRHHNECTRQYPELWHVPVDGDMVLDGEVCCTDPDTGSIDFELVMDRFQLKKADKISKLVKHRPVHCIVWDILFLNGRVAKRKDRKYVSMRSHDWIKIINYQYEEVYLAGYRKDEYGWLAHVEENGVKRPAGIIKLGGSPRSDNSWKHKVFSEDI